MDACSACTCTYTGRDSNRSRKLHSPTEQHLSFRLMHVAIYVRTTLVHKIFVNKTVMMFIHDVDRAKSGDFGVFFNQFTSDFTLQ